VVDALTVAIAVLVTLWVAGVAFAVWWLSSVITPAVREILESGDEEERRKVINALYPPRFRRD
jgi:flagellar basal body-associated protein FliL